MTLDSVSLLKKFSFKLLFVVVGFMEIFSILLFKSLSLIIKSSSSNNF